MPPNDAPAGVVVVLVRPESPANVGAAARAMRNCGLDRLRLVDAGDWRTVECWRTAWGAHEVLERAVEAADLASAVSDASYVVALSGKARGGAPAADVRDAAREVAGVAAAGQVAALVFGPESWGLTTAEIDLCGRAATIPSHPAQPSLNLGQAVMVAAYEVHRAVAASRYGDAGGAVVPYQSGGNPRTPARSDYGDAGGAVVPDPSGGNPRTPARRNRPETAPLAAAALASHAQKQEMLALLRRGLEAADALPRARRDQAFQEWTALFQRADLTAREVQLLQHMARRMMRLHTPAAGDLDR